MCYFWRELGHETICVMMQNMIILLLLPHFTIRLLFYSSGLLLTPPSFFLSMIKFCFGSYIMVQLCNIQMNYSWLIVSYYIYIQVMGMIVGCVESVFFFSLEQ